MSSQQQLCFDVPNAQVCVTFTPADQPLVSQLIFPSISSTRPTLNTREVIDRLLSQI